MKIHGVLFFCFLSALCGGNTRLVSAEIFSGAEGGTGSLNCHLALTGNRKFFCRNRCAAEDILIKTDDVSAQSGRYSMSYKNESSSRGILTVTITNLTRSDSGRYRCGIGKTMLPESSYDYEVRVSDEPFLDRTVFTHSDIKGEDITYPCSYTVYGKHKFFCKGECNKQEDILVETDGNRGQSGRYVIEYREGSIFGMYLTIKQATTSDTGRYVCGYGRALFPDSKRKFTIIVIDDSTSTSTSTSTSNATTQMPTTHSAALSNHRNNKQLTATTNVTHPGYFLPLVVCVSMVGVLLLVVFLLLLYVRKMRRNFPSNGRDMYPVIYREMAPSSTCEDFENSRS